MECCRGCSAILCVPFQGLQVFSGVSVFMSVSERRSRQRFPLALAVEYRLLGPGAHSGWGWTSNISSRGVLFEVAGQETPFGLIEVVVSWPYILDGVCALKLVMKGRVVRNGGRSVAVASTAHEFRTAGPVIPGRGALRFRTSAF
jgi:hypothetical protein